MRIAAISDIHGNLAALDAVLADIGRRGVDLTVNLGDMLSGPLDPVGTADRLIALDLPTIRGNHERQLLTLERVAMGASDACTAPQLSDCHRAWLASVPVGMRIAPDILLCHGTPRSDLEYYLDHVGPSGARAATASEIGERTGAEAAALILCGHTHVPRSHRRPNGQLIVNPGSVGLPAYDDDHPFPHVMESGTPQARYAIAERAGDGRWTAEPIAVDYDWDMAARTAEGRGRPDWAIALRTGRMQ
ncbi:MULTISPECIES: metallophosphoesterase family protein [unclassified Sphingomonas]|uniref:metallophosphoesterase family protein n=1 Tax=unclassified Sphingomonas TaxID=196159 RepID=UPI0006F7C70B|nr:MULTISPECIES: metallophosphoesterase family protein [unclassified Sphingomonas]KQX17554.1 metallophosphoesterase [Sphingomonas sp. Root1294]KQY70480.1 metallophosphoesterase [Sphingomonas sp. Root50]KRB92034.1 metallophosphoesterase [Sphingomonas sp. Root720]